MIQNTLRNSFVRLVAILVTSASVLLVTSPLAIAASLSGVVGIAPAVVDLTSEGSADWVHWGHTSATDVDRKTGVTPQISAISAVGGGAPWRSTAMPTTYSWFDGIPTASASNSQSGLGTFKAGRGVEFTVPADATPKILYVYVGAVNGATGRFEASLSDGSAPAYSTELYQSSGATTYRVALTYEAASAGQTLTVRYVIDRKDIASAGSITLDSATLQSGSGGNQPPVLAPIGTLYIQEGQTLTLPISASDADGPAPLNLSATNTLPGNPIILTDFGGGSGELNLIPTVGDAAGSPYSVTVTASDGDGAIDEETFDINVFTSTVAAQWTRWQHSFTSTNIYTNPYADVTLSVTYTGPSGQIIQSYGFWDGGNTFRIRFMFPETGVWTWQTSCSDATNNGLHGLTGTVDVASYGGTNPLLLKGYPKVSADNRYLVHGDGTPLFWLADTAWSAPMSATHTDWQTYINNRRDKRFNVVALNVAFEWNDAADGLDLNGNAPFFGANVVDLNQWNPAFWQEYERKVQYANGQGILIAIVGAMQPRRLDPISSESPLLQLFARNLAARFLGDFVVYSPSMDVPYMEIGNEVGLAIRDAAPFHLITQHTVHFDDVDGDGTNDAVQSAELYYDQSYLDFSGIQPGAGWKAFRDFGGDASSVTETANNLAAQNAIEWHQILYNRSPHKPVINLEGVYDASTRHDPADPHSIYLPRMARSDAYWTVLSGSAGHTFGAGQIFSWLPRTGAPQGGDWPWYVAMDMPSSFEMQYLYELFTSMEWWRLIPRHDLIMTPQPVEWIDHMVLSKTDLGDVAVAYLPNNAEIEIDMSTFPTGMLPTWFNPVTNTYQVGPTAIAPSGTHAFQKPVAWQDAVLILESTDINQRPVFNAISPASIEEGQLLTIPVSASDNDGPDPLVLTATNYPAGATFTDFVDGTGAFSWTPANGDAAGSPYSVTFTATDGSGATSTVTVSITVTSSGGGNQAPILNPIGPQTVTEGQLLTVSLSASDIDGPAPLTLSETNTLPGNPSILTDAGGGVGTLNWTPALGDAVSSPFSIAVTATDGSNAASSETVTVTVLPAGGGNQAPALNQIGPQTVTEGQLLTVPLSAIDADGPPPLTLSETNTLPGNPSILTDAGDGVGTLNWTPAVGDANGSPYSVIVSASDGSGVSSSETVSLTVVPAGGGSGGLTGSAAVAPSGVNLTSSGSADWIHWGLPATTALNRKAGVSPQISNYSPVGAAVPWLKTNMPTGYAWTDGTPTASVSAARSALGIFKAGKGVQFTVTADTIPKTLQVYVGTVNGATGRFEASLSDGSAPAYVTELYQANGASTRVVTLTFQAASTGQTLTVRYIVDRKDDPSAGSITLEAVALQSVDGNQPPMLNTIGPQSVEENQLLTIPVSATDDGPLPLVLTATNLPTGASFNDVGDGTGEFSWTPTTDDATGSPYSVTFSATDDDGSGLADSETVMITVNPAGGGNQPPVLTPIAPQSVEENQTLTYAVSATDADGPAPLVLTATNLPPGASFTDFGAGSGQFSWTPITGDASGSPYSVTFTATGDGGAGLADSETVVITVNPAGGSSGSLSGGAAVAVPSVDLTSAGSADWIHWGLTSITDTKRKVGVSPQISNYTPVGGAVPWLRTNMPTSYAWTDGTPTASIGAARSALGIFKVGKGLQFTVPADTTVKTLQVYAGTVNGATGRLEASLSDGSAPAYSTEIYQASGTSTRIVTLTFQAASAGQTLTVRYVVDRKDNSSAGSITLEAAALR